MHKPHSAFLAQARHLAAACRITDGNSFQLASHNPASTLGLGHDAKKTAKDFLEDSIAALAEFQDKLYAQSRWAVLLILQALDAAGKDGVIKHVFSGLNPQGCQVHSFKTPSADELDHDFLWRCHLHLPPRGHIGIFNRSYYEEVLVVRVHPEILQAQKLPPCLLTDALWQERLHDIRHFESYLARQGTVVIKVFLHLSREEQKQRFLERLDTPSKNWKFSPSDLRERPFWGAYQHAYEEAIRHTATPHAPWYVVPADHKWLARLAVASILVDTLISLGLNYPQLSGSQHQQLEQARATLLNEAP